MVRKKLKTLHMHFKALNTINANIHHLPGQGISSLQGSVTAALPGQVAPSSATVGLLQALALFLVPAHV